MAEKVEYQQEVAAEEQVADNVVVFNTDNNNSNNANTAVNLEWEIVHNFDIVDDMNIFPFAEVEGLKTRIKYNPTVLDILEFYLTDRVIDLIVTETNCFAEDYSLENSDSSDSWTPADAAEIKEFISLLLLMGITKIPNLKTYWSKDEL